MFTIAIVARFHELNHAAAQTLPGGAHQQAQRAGSLAFAVSGVDDEEPARGFFIVFAAPFVFTFDCHRALVKFRGGLLPALLDFANYLAGGSPPLNERQ